MGEIARALGQGSSFTYKGQTYPLSPLTFEIQGAFETWLESNAWAGYRRAPRSERAELLKEISENLAAKAYSFGSQACAKALNGLAGQKYLLFLLMLKGRKSDGPEVTQALVDEIVQEDLEATMAQLNAVLNDPNPPTPVMDRGHPSPASVPSS